MTVRQKTTGIFTCIKCDAQSPKWNGQCLECGSWGTLQESSVSGTQGKTSNARPSPLQDFSILQSDDTKRTPVGTGEIDRVFGGGIVKGSVTLIGGEPGIGKSTIALMIAASLAKKGLSGIYISGEESAGQIKMRSDRLNIGAEGLSFLGVTDADSIIATIEKERPFMAVIDSIQTIRSESIPSEAGATNQIRGTTGMLVSLAKRTGTAILIVGHVTKDGNVAGPKTLEHLVDTVLSFEGERSHSLRVLRVLKNRFGSSDETGLFEMDEKGLKEVTDPSSLLLGERGSGTAGSAISCIIEGTRPILVEIQALVQRSGQGYPVRRATGFDVSRLEMLIAVMAARGGVSLNDHDVFINVVGGLKIRQTSADLAVILALASAASNRALPTDLVAWGEVGLGGEIRPVTGLDKRVAECSKLGLKHLITAVPKSKKIKKSELEIKDVRSVAALLTMFVPAQKNKAT